MGVAGTEMSKSPLRTFGVGVGVEITVLVDAAAAA